MKIVGIWPGAKQLIRLERHTVEKGLTLQSVTYAITKLVELARDPESEPISFVSLGTSTNGAAVSIVGDRISYTITVQNTGNVTLSAPSITDPGCTGLGAATGDAGTHTSDTTPVSVPTAEVAPPARLVTTTS